MYTKKGPEGPLSEMSRIGRDQTPRPAVEKAVKRPISSRATGAKRSAWRSMREKVMAHLGVFGWNPGGAGPSVWTTSM